MRCRPTRDRRTSPPTATATASDGERLTGEWLEQLARLKLGGKRRISLPRSWTDRGPQALPHRLAVDGLTPARELVDALVFRLHAATGGAE
jgi:hypothetical protein